METIAAALSLAKMIGADKWLGTLIAGDKGAEVADKVVGIAQQVTGTASPAAAVAAVTNDREHQLQLESALYAHEEEIAKLSADAVEQARDYRLNELKSGNWLAANTFYIVLLAATLFGFGYCLLLTLYPLPPSGERYADLILNVLILGGAGAVGKFLLGSWRDAKTNTNAMPGRRFEDLADYGEK